MHRRRSARPKPAALAAVALITTAGVGARPASAIVGTASNLNINTFLGADTFYNAGYTGSRAIVANIEAGLVWNGHETLNQVNTYFNDSSITGQFDRHATWVGSTINGRRTAGGGEYQRGIAYGATLWSGAISTGWATPTPPSTFSLGFGFNASTFIYAYATAMSVGLGPNAQTADVINSSWGTGGETNGDNFYTLTLDSYVFATGKTLVFAAGNSGPGSNTVFAPGWALNNIAVASLGSDTTNPPYSTVSTFSSRSPSDFFIPADFQGITGTLVTGARAAVDIAAPGQDLTLAEYDGPTGGNAFGGPSSLANNLYQGGLNGTSFATPIVSGGAALVVDAGKALFPTDSDAINGRIIKAVLMNSADKNVGGWNNGQSLVNGVITTTQGLDYALGAGRLDLAAAFSQYTAGTTDLPGLTGGTVDPIGWDYGKVTVKAPQNNYLVDTILSAGQHMTATLDWFAFEQGGISYGAFDNLDLQVWHATGGVADTLIAQSISLYNSSEELSFDLPSDGQYLIRVVRTGNVFNFAGDPSMDEYGLAWDVTAVPEPASIGLVGFGVIVLVGKRRGRFSDHVQPRAVKRGR
jgi:hypothetical protein